MGLFWLWLLGLAMAAGPAPAWERLGMARLHTNGAFTNDVFGDRHDRWHGSSYRAGLLPSPGQGGPDMVELRFFTGALTPASLAGPDPSGRPLAGDAGPGMRGYLLGPKGSLEAGLDLAAAGPQTRYPEIPPRLRSPGEDPGPALEDGQIGDALNPTLVLAATRRLPAAERAPYRALASLQLQAGSQTQFRLGGDLVLGSAGGGALPLRAAAAGDLIPVSRQQAEGGGPVPGADASHVLRSARPPQDRGYRPADLRHRARIGGLWRWGQGRQVFYGVVFLDEEFGEQPEAQMVGTVHVNWRF
ncbi:lipid A-modifier LpxR family protein [Poseidonocella sp. HB161398]|uniref:lipid A-modifier LpxR family protein n=1 Tax=Poseidonocella sp. HB161398 TaxID=2320855 RepID=UPI001107EBEC|nr:lipid A-modifier LpxR family protein [Poseidonocella sp. HB161398]